MRNSCCNVGIIQDVIDDIVTEIRDNLGRVLQQNSINVASIINFQAIFDESYTRPFDGLDTFYQQIQFFKNVFGLIVSDSRKCTI